MLLSTLCSNPSKFQSPIPPIRYNNLDGERSSKVCMLSTKRLRCPTGVHRLNPNYMLTVDRIADVLDDLAVRLYRKKEIKAE